MNPTLQTTFECNHPVALVTGSAAPRVGRAIALRMASLGCHIAIHARTSLDDAHEVAKQVTGLGVESHVLRADIEDPVAVQRMVSEIAARFGRIDVLVNAAAIWEPKPLEEVTSEEVLRYFQVNALGTFHAAKSVGLRMVAQPTGGAIVNISDWATQRPYLDHAAYFPSKGAVETLTRSLAVELGQRNPRVRVNCIQPGPVLLGPGIDQQTKAALEQSVLVKRIGTAEEVAHAVEFLCVNQFVTGVMLPVDGGKSIFANDGLQVGLNTG